MPKDDEIDRLQEEFFLLIRGHEGNAVASRFLKMVEEVRQERDLLRRSIRTMYCWLSQSGLEGEKLSFLSHRPEVRRALDEAEHTRGM